MANKLLLVLCLTVLLPAVAPGRTFNYGDVKITPDPEQRGYGSHGYTEYGFDIVNDANERRRVTLVMGSEHTGRRSGDQLRSISRTVEVSAGSRVHISLYQPIDPPLYSDGVNVTIDGKRREERIPLQITKSSGGSRGRLILASGGFNVDTLRGMPHAGGMWVSREIVGPERGAAPWPTNWLGYSRYDGVVVTAAFLAALEPKAREALFSYVECGGSLTVLGQAQLPGGWKAEQGNGYTRYRLGFGECIVTAERMLWNQPVATEISRSWADTANPWSNSYAPLQANSQFPVVDNLSIPVRGLFVLMFGFAVVLGPVNFWLLARWKRRIWMLWTVPAISALSCAAVFGYMVVAEGWSGHLRTEAITVLDQNARRASTVGWTAFYTPLTPGDGLRFSQQTELAMQLGLNGRDNYYRRGGGKSCELDWSDGQRLTRGWIAARVPAHFRLRKSEETRLRISVHRERDGGLSAVNELGADIKKLTVADEGGRLYAAGPIAAGARVSLQPTGKVVPPEDPKLKPLGDERVSLRGIYTDDWLRQAQAIRSNSDKYLAPLRYVADVDGSPFVEDGLSRAGDARRSAVVIGILKEIER